MITPDRGRVRLRDAAALRPHLHRLRPDHRNTVADRPRLDAARSPKRSNPLGKAQTDTKQIPRRADTRCRRTSGPPGFGALIAEQAQPDPASHGRPRPSVRRVRPGLAGQPRTAHPHRNRDRDTHHSQGDRHPQHRARSGPAPVRRAGRGGRTRGIVTGFAGSELKLTFSSLHDPAVLRGSRAQHVADGLE